MTRDSRWWWFVMGAAMVTSVSSRMDLLDLLLPAEHTDKAHAIIELLSLMVAATAGVMRASPIHTISDEGKAKFIAKAETARFKARTK